MLPKGVNTGENVEISGAPPISWLAITLLVIGVLFVAIVSCYFCLRHNNLHRSNVAANGTTEHALSHNGMLQSSYDRVWRVSTEHEEHIYEMEKHVKPFVQNVNNMCLLYMVKEYYPKWEEDQKYRDHYKKMAWEQMNNGWKKGMDLNNFVKLNFEKVAWEHFDKKYRSQYGSEWKDIPDFRFQYEQELRRIQQLVKDEKNNWKVLHHRLMDVNKAKLRQDLYNRSVMNDHPLYQPSLIPHRRLASQTQPGMLRPCHVVGLLSVLLVFSVGILAMHLSKQRDHKRSETENTRESRV